MTLDTLLAEIFQKVDEESIIVPALFFGLSVQSEDLRAYGLGYPYSTLHSSLSPYIENVFLVLGEVATNAVQIDLAVLEMAAYLNQNGRKALTGEKIPGNYLSTFQLDDQVLLDEYGVGYALYARDSYVLAHDYNLGKTTDDTPALSRGYVLRSAQVLSTRIYDYVHPFVGSTFDNLPDLKPAIQQILLSVPAIKTATFSTSIYTQERTIAVQIKAQLYGELTFEVVIRA